MKKRSKRIQILLGIAVSFFILALPAYLRCTQLSQSKFVSSDLGFESSDQEEALPDTEKELKVFGPNAFPINFLLATNVFDQSSYVLPQALSLRQGIVVLRC